MKAILTQYRVTSRKANLVADLVRGKRVQEAIDMLKFTPKKTAPVLKKLIESAVANGVNNFKQNKADLYIKEIIVTEGPTLKRSVPVSRGRANPILKRTANITVKLAVMVSDKKVEASPAPKAEPKTAKTTVKTVKKAKK